MKTMKMYEDARNQCGTRIQGSIAVIRNEQENAIVNELFVATYGHGIDVCARIFSMLELGAKITTFLERKLPLFIRMSRIFATSLFRMPF